MDDGDVCSRATEIDQRVLTDGSRGLVATIHVDDYTFASLLTSIYSVVPRLMGCGHTTSGYRYVIPWLDDLV